MTDLTPHQTAVLKKFTTDLEYYSRWCLKIVDKKGVLMPLVFNRTQQYIHNRLEKQRRDTGMVRAVILKGRQQGCTTLIQARYWWKTNFIPNLSAYVLAHQVESTIKIFGMAQRFRRNLPVDLQMPLEKDTERSMQMTNGSGYSVGTAGSAQIGRGMTVNLFHGSEVAFYERADEISTGLLQAVPDSVGSEMIMESTANGPGNFFYDLVQGAIAGKNGFQLIFAPWYWDPEYLDPVSLLEKDLDDAEVKYYEAYKDDGLTLAHLAWRRRKIASLGGKLYKFIQEYPFNPDEAFVRSEDRFFSLYQVYAARHRKIKDDPTAPLIIGVDQGRSTDDTIICRRIGPIIKPFEYIPADDGSERDMRLAGRLAQIIDREKPDMVCIDTTNEHGAYDRLTELGYSKRVVKAVHFGEKALDPTRHRNKRVEMYFSLREWFEDDRASIPDDQRFVSEIGAVPVERESSNNVAYLVSKEDIKKELGHSPDLLDAAILTFAWPVRKKNNLTNTEKRDTLSPKVEFHSSLKSLRR